MSTEGQPVAQSSLVHVAGAFVLMGGWAVYANSAHPMPAPLIAGAVQGALSGLITFGLKRLIERVSRQFSGLAGLLIPPIAAFAVSATLLTLLHAASGTPEIAATIAVPLTVSTSYAALYSWGLWNRQARMK